MKYQRLIPSGFKGIGIRNFLVCSKNFCNFPYKYIFFLRIAKNYLWGMWLGGGGLGGIFCKELYIFKILNILTIKPKFNTFYFNTHSVSLKPFKKINFKFFLGIFLDIARIKSKSFNFKVYTVNKLSLVTTTSPNKHGNCKRRLESRLWFLIFHAWQRKWKNEAVRQTS